MIIKKKRIVNLQKYMNSFKLNDEIYIGLNNINNYTSKLNQIGFSSKLTEGERVLPSASFGSVCLFNAEGKLIPLKNKPKETAYRQALWSWTDWGDNEHSKIVDIPYERYPRKFISPPSIELNIVVNKNLDKLIVSDKLIYNKNNQDLIKHTINLFLQIFGECEILNIDMNQNIIPCKNPIRLNWDVLPKGKYPWKKLKIELQHLLNTVKKGNKPVVEDRLETINSYNPNFTAIGNGGFNGYTVFGFKDKNLYVLESIYTGNATYVFEEDWQELSQKTKAEILNFNLQKYRIIHNKSWKSEINNILA